MIIHHRKGSLADNNDIPYTTINYSLMGWVIEFNCLGLTEIK